MNIKVSFCIVTDSQKELLKDCLKSIYKFKPNFPFEIYVVDNASINEIYKMVERNFPEVKLIVNKKKYGFGKNNNFALKKCKGEYIVILNDDTLILKDSINKMIEFLDKRNNIGAAGLKQYYENGEIQLVTKKELPNLWSYIINKVFLGKFFKSYKKNKNYIESGEVKVLSGACMFVRKDIFDKIGFFDEKFRFYWEDVDLCRRIGEAGYKLYYNSECEIMHFQGMSISKKMKAQSRIEEFRSMIYYYHKYNELKFYWIIKYIYVSTNMINFFLFLFIRPSNSAEFMEIVIWHLKHLTIKSIL